MEALNDLTDDERNVLKKYYVNLKSDLDAVVKYLSWQNLNMLMNMYIDVAKRAGMDGVRLSSPLTRLLLEIKVAQEDLGIKFGPRNLTHRKYENTVSNFLISFLERNDEEAKDYLREAAKLRRSLGWQLSLLL